MKTKFNYKILLVLLMTLCVGLFSSCDNDDEVNEKDIIGLWTFVNVTADIDHPNKKILEEEKIVVGFATIFLQGASIDIKADKTFVLTAPFGGSETGTYSKNGNKFTITMNGETVDSDDMLSSGAYIILENDVLTIITNNLNSDEYLGKGFTKYIVKLVFKK